MAVHCLSEMVVGAIDSNSVDEHTVSELQTRFDVEVGATTW